MTGTRTATPRQQAGRDPWTPVFLCQDFLGHSTHARFLEEYLTRLGWPDIPVIRFSVGNVQSLLARTALRITGARLPVRSVSTSGGDLWATRTFLVQSRLAATALRRQGSDSPDLVYVHSHSAGLVLGKVARGVPVVVSLDTTIPAELRMMRGHARTLDRPSLALERRILHRADLVVTFSDWARDSVINDCGVETDTVVTIPNGVHAVTASAHDVVTPLLRRIDLPIVGFVGNDFERKGGYRLLEAHQRYLASKVHLVLVTRQSVKVGRTTNVTLLCNLDRDTLLTQVLPRFTVLAHPAILDWSPYGVIEALAAGIPVVATRIAALPEMVADGVNGILLDDASPRQLAEAIESIALDEARAARMARESRLRFAERFDADVNYPRLLGTLREMST